MNPNQSQDEPVLFGAGGNWRVTDEVVDPKVVLQQGDLSCGVACGEMLLTDRGRNVAQRDIENLTGVPFPMRIGDDPWEGTRYKMIKDDFLKHWTQHGVYRRIK